LTQKDKRSLLAVKHDDEDELMEDKLPEYEHISDLDFN